MADLALNDAPMLATQDKPIRKDFLTRITKATAHKMTEARAKARAERARLAAEAAAAELQRAAAEAERVRLEAVRKPNAELIRLVEAEIDRVKAALEGDLKPQDRAKLVQSLDTLLDRRRVFLGEPLPGSFRPAAESPKSGFLSLPGSSKAGSKAGSRDAQE